MRHTRRRDIGPKSSSGAGPRSSYWIFGPLPDLTCVLLTPLVILAVFAAARRGGWAGGLVAFALALAMAHYLPGILRAYGDRALFKRFRIRLTLAPLVLVASTTGMAYLNLNFVFLLLGLWSAWHWMMQIYGFARIYDARSGRTPARLDQAVCLAWFGTAVFVLNDALPAYATRFYQSGGTLLPAWPFEAFTQAWFVLTLTLTVIYGLYLLWGGMDRRWPNPLKLVFLILSFGYLTHTASLLDEPIVA
jgi:hypothetical protein